MISLKDKIELFDSVETDLKRLYQLAKDIDRRVSETLIRDRKSYDNLKFWSDRLEGYLNSAIYATFDFLARLTIGSVLLERIDYENCVWTSAIFLEGNLIKYLQNTSSCSVPAEFSINPTGKF